MVKTAKSKAHKVFGDAMTFMIWFAICGYISSTVSFYLGDPLPNNQVSAMGGFILAAVVMFAFSKAERKVAGHS